MFNKCQCQEIRQLNIALYWSGVEDLWTLLTTNFIHSVHKNNDLIRLLIFSCHCLHNWSCTATYRPFYVVRGHRSIRMIHVAYCKSCSFQLDSVFFVRYSGWIVRFSPYTMACKRSLVYSFMRSFYSQILMQFLRWYEQNHLLSSIFGKNTWCKQECQSIFSRQSTKVFRQYALKKSVIISYSIINLFSVNNLHCFKPLSNITIYKMERPFSYPYKFVYHALTLLNRRPFKFIGI